MFYKGIQNTKNSEILCLNTKITIGKFLTVFWSGILEKNDLV